MIEQRGLIIGPNDLLALLPTTAFKITSHDNTAFRTKRGQALHNAVLNAGAVSESIFDAAHGRRYMCFIYRTPAERKACWEYKTGGAA